MRTVKISTKSDVYCFCSLSISVLSLDKISHLLEFLFHSMQLWAATHTTPTIEAAK